MEEKPQKIIKIEPYRGQNEEIIEGYKTKISLFDNRLEYKVNYKQKVKIVKTVGGVDSPEEDSLMFNKQEGFILKSKITSVIRYVETDYKEEDNQPFEIHYVEIYVENNSLNISSATEKDQILLYNELYNWIFNK